MAGALWVLVGLVAAAWALALCLTRVRRLHRLHIRVDAARAGLDAALVRRVVASAATGINAGLLVPDAVEGDPETAANALSRALVRLDRAALPTEVRAELAEAEQLLVLARRVHNDAVRDTLGLRSLRLVRWLRLAGTAPMPAYFEIADPVAGLTYDQVSPSQD
jgi:hypothetical protein